MPAWASTSSRCGARHVELIEKAEHYLERVALADRRATLAPTLSHGDQRKLEVAILLALEPDIFMFDEPTAGMSVDEVPVILDLIHEIKQQRDKTVLLVEHKMDVVRSLADRIIVLHQGELVADGVPAEVIASPIVQEAYLGVQRTALAPWRLVAETLLTLAGVHTHIGHYHILQGVDFVVPRGELTMLLGRNGAGKTTTLRTIMGLWRASAGAIRFDGRRHHAARHAGDRPPRHRLRARDHGHLRRPHGAREPGARGAQRARPTSSAWTGSSASSRR